jgi:hypothetical protein
MTAFANKVEHHFSKKVSHMFGAGFVTGMLVQPLEKLKEAAFSGFERAGDIKEHAEKLHITAEEYQLIAAAADEAHMTTDEWISSMKKSGEPLSQIIGKLEQFRGKIEFTNEEIETLADDSLAKLGKRLGTWVGKAYTSASGMVGEMASGATAFFMTPGWWKHPFQTRKEVLAGLAKDEEIQKEIAAQASGNLPGLFAGAARKQELGFNVNEWQRAGAFVGGPAAPVGVSHVATVAQRQLTQQEKMVDLLEAINSNTALTKSGAADMLTSLYKLF